MLRKYIILMVLIFILSISTFGQDAVIRLLLYGEESPVLYEYQDTLINSSLQMMVREAEYLFDKYYDASGAYTITNYDITDSNYVYSRTPVTQYLGLLNALYKITGRTNYFNRMKQLYDNLDARGDVWTGNSGDSCYSINLAPYAAGQYGFTWNDGQYHGAGLTIYERTGDVYYLNRAKAFSDALYNSVNRSIPGEVGWSTGYFYYGDGTPNMRVNINAAACEWWNVLREDSILTDNVASYALIDSLIDSGWAYVNNAWMETGDSAGFALRADSVAGIDFFYSLFTVVPFLTVAEYYNNLDSVATDFKAKVQKIVNHYSQDAAFNQTYKAHYDAAYVSLFLKWAAKFNIIPTVRAEHYYSWLRKATHHNPINGINPSAYALASGQRRGLAFLFDYLRFAVTYLNDETFDEDYARYTFDNWLNNATNFYLYDGYPIHQVLAVGTSLGYSAICGFYTGDSSPLTPYESSWTRDNENLIIDFPLQGNGKTYTLTHRLGSGYSKVNASASDTLIFTLNNTNDTWYVCYYDENNQLQHKNRTEMIALDSIHIIGNRGVYVTQADFNGGVDRTSVGMIFNKGVTTFKYRSEHSTGSIFKSTTTADSIYVFYNDFNQTQGFMYNEGSFTYVNNFVADVLTQAKQILDNGLDYEGILVNQYPIEENYSIYGNLLYVSNFAAGLDGWSKARSVITGNIDSVSDGVISKNDCLSFYADGTTNNHVAFKTVVTIAQGNVYNIKANIYIPSTNTNINGLKINIGGGAVDTFNITATGQWIYIDKNITHTEVASIIYLFPMKNGNIVFTGANSASDDLFYIKDFTIRTVQ